MIFQASMIINCLLNVTQKIMILHFHQILQIKNFFTTLSKVINHVFRKMFHKFAKLIIRLREIVQCYKQLTIYKKIQKLTLVSKEKHCQ